MYRKNKHINSKTKNNKNGLFSPFSFDQTLDARLSDFEECLKFSYFVFQGFMHLLRLDEICSLKSDPFDSQRDWLTAELFDCLLSIEQRYFLK